MLFALIFFIDFLILKKDEQGKYIMQVRFKKKKVMETSDKRRRTNKKSTTGVENENSKKNHAEVRLKKRVREKRKKKLKGNLENLRDPI